MTVECRCCHDWLHRDDFQPTVFTHAEQIEEYHGGPVCTLCMDNLVVCDCGTVMQRANAYSDGNGGWTAEAPAGN
jgi:hypothetical protein